MMNNEEPTTRRIRLLSLHLNPLEQQQQQQIQVEDCSSGRAKLDVNFTNNLSTYMRGKHRDIQEIVFEYFNSRPDLQTPIEILKDDYRDLCMKQLVGIVRDCGIKPLTYVVNDPQKYFAMIEAVGSVDMSLGIKLGVQYRYIIITNSSFSIDRINNLRFRVFLLV